LSPRGRNTGGQINIDSERNLVASGGLNH